MKVTANVKSIVTVEDFTVTLSPDEVAAMRSIICEHLTTGSGSFYTFGADLRNQIDAAQSAATVDTSTDPDDYFWTGKGDENLRAGRKIYAIKECRQATSCGLKEAKDAADRRGRSLGL